MHFAHEWALRGQNGIRRPSRRREARARGGASQLSLETERQLIVFQVRRHALRVAGELVDDRVILKKEPYPIGKDEADERRIRAHGGVRGNELSSALVEDVGVGVVIIG